MYEEIYALSPIFARFPALLLVFIAQAVYPRHRFDLHFSAGILTFSVTCGGFALPRHCHPPRSYIMENIQSIVLSGGTPCRNRKKDLNNIYISERMQECLRLFHAAR